MNYISVEEVATKEPVAGYHGRFVHSEHMTLAFWTVVAGAPLPEHQHPHEQVLHLQEGIYELVLNGERMRLEAGSVVVIPGNAPHSGEAITDCRILDVFHPVREAYR